MIKPQPTPKRVFLLNEVVTSRSEGLRTRDRLNIYRIRRRKEQEAEENNQRSGWIMWPNGTRNEHERSGGHQQEQENLEKSCWGLIVSERLTEEKLECIM